MVAKLVLIALSELQAPFRFPVLNSSTLKYIEQTNKEMNVYSVLGNVALLRIAKEKER